jgi:hypothetical protein
LMIAYAHVTPRKERERLAEYLHSSTVFSA